MTLLRTERVLRITILCERLVIIASITKANTFVLGDVTLGMGSMMGPSITVFVIKHDSNFFSS